jgi:hypothetical protein
MCGKEVQAARNGPSEDRKCWQRVELGIQGHLPRGARVGEEPPDAPVSSDEMTGIQALERTAPTKLMIAGKPARIEFESREGHSSSGPSQ